MAKSSQNKEIVRRVFEAFFVVDDEVLQELLSPNFVAHSMPPGFSKDQEGFLELARQCAAGLTYQDTALHELLEAEDGKVITRFTTRAAHTGELFGVPASNRTVTMTGIEIYATANSKVTDWWGELNMSDLFDALPGQAVPGTSGSA
jgi:predicted ester cyclase